MSMTKVLVSVAALVGVLALAPTAQAQSYSKHIYNATSAPEKCLGVKEADLSHPFMAKCAGYPAENWATGVPNGQGFIRFQSQRTGPGMCLGVAAADTSTVKMASCASVKNQQWKLTPTDQPDTFTITSQLSGPGMCLGISPNSDKTELDMNACHGYPGQTWIIHQ
jgi:hypothetical protein